MTNDELLAGFLDRSLSEDGLLEFEARQTVSPEFAQTVREMLAVESVLRTATPVIAIPTAFLQDVENTVAERVVSATSSRGILSGLSSIWTWIGGAALVAVGIGAYSLYHGPATSNQPMADPAIRQQQVVMATKVEDEPAVLPAPATTTTNEPVTAIVKRNDERPDTKSATSTPEPITLGKQPAQRTASDVSFGTTNPASTLENLKSDYNAAISADNDVLSAQIALEIGRHLSVRMKNYDESERYLRLALTHARSVRVPEYEVDALGELGLLARERGNMTEAAGLLKQAVARGNASGLSTKKYSAALDNLDGR